MARLTRWLIILLCACALAAVGAMGHHANRRIVRSGVNSVPTNGLISYWSFDGDANDKFGTNNGTVNSATLTNGVKGVANTAYDFINSTITFSSVIIPVGAKSVLFWFKARTGADMWIIGNCYNTSQFGHRFGFWEDDTYKKCLSFGHAQGVGSWNWLFFITNGVVLNTWIQCTLTWDGSASANSVSLYTNGVLLGLRSPGGAETGTPTYNLIMGNNPFDSTTPFNGAIDEVRIYNRVLASNEVYNIYQIEKP